MIACSYGCRWTSAELSLGLGLPAIVGERLVGLGHLVGVLATLDRGAESIGGVQHFVHEALGHGLLPPLPGEGDQPAHRQRRRSSRLDLDRHLVGGATDTTAL